MEEYGYTSTHPLGHTGPVTGTLYFYLLFYYSLASDRRFILKRVLTCLHCFTGPIQLGKSEYYSTLTVRQAHLTIYVYCGHRTNILANVFSCTTCQARSVTYCFVYLSDSKFRSGICA